MPVQCHALSTVQYRFKIREASPRGTERLWSMETRIYEIETDEFHDSVAAQEIFSGGVKTFPFPHLPLP